MLYICIFSNKLDLNQTIRVSHKLVSLNQKQKSYYSGILCVSSSHTRLGYKLLPVTNALAYFAVRWEKSFIGLTFVLK
jgi:hypothetical protein